jgi:hypothetical protein
MALYRALVTLNMTSGLNEDAATNTFHFDADTVADLADAYGSLLAFYQQLDNRLSNLIDENNVTVEWYRLSDTPPRAPVRLDTMTALAVGADEGVPEVALVLSFQGAKISGLPQNRRRGRVYLGPLADTAEPRPTSTTIQSILPAGQGLLDASNLSTNWTWVQWSPTNGIGIPVTDGWIDNEFDTQRRRGRKATARSTFN